jgi:hypothetical protein
MDELHHDRNHRVNDIEENNNIASSNKMDYVLDSSTTGVPSSSTHERLVDAAGVVQEQPQQQQQQLPRWYPYYRGKPVYHGNGEALGWALDAIGRAVPFIGSGAFLGTALLRLAKQAAGCEIDPPPGSNKVPDCDQRVYGIRPSSLLTTYTMVVGVLSAVLLPFMGAIVDYTPHRRQIGRCLSVMFCILLFPQIFLTSHTWFPIAIIQIFVAFVGWAQTNVTYAY